MGLKTFIYLSSAVLVCASCGKNGVGSDELRLNLGVEVPAAASTGMIRVFDYDCSSLSRKGEHFISSREGDVFSREMTIRRGGYRFVAYNFDMPDTFIRGDVSFNTLEAYTAGIQENIRNRFDLDASESICNTPDRLYAGICEKPESGEVSESLVFPVSEVTSEWTVEIPVEGIGNVSYSGCSISGVQTTYHFDGGEGECGWVYTALDRRNGVLHAKFNVFGFAHAPSSEMIISVSNGSSTYNYIKEIGDLVLASLLDGTNRIVLNEKIIVPAPEGTSEESGNGGFEPQVGEWKQQTGEILI